MSNKNFKNPNRHNYNQYSKENNEAAVAPEFVEEKELIEKVEDVEEVKEEIEEEVEETDEKPKQAEESKTWIGIVNCSKLNVRRRPDKDSDPICIVEKDCELKIDPTYLNENWFKVKTPTGASGYCMSTFIDLNKEG